MPRTLMIILIFIPALVQAGVIVGDKEWRQVTDTTSLSWIELANVCNINTGICSGSLGGVDFDGWTWGTLDDVTSLFNTFLPPGLQLGPDIASIGQGSSSWAPLFVESFTPTVIDSIGSIVLGFARGLHFNDARDAFSIEPLIRDSSGASTLDQARIDIFTDWRRNSDGRTGAWLYKPAGVPEPTAIAEPATFGLLGLGVLALGLASRRRWYA